MNMIVDGLPYYVKIKGKRYKINVDYRCMLKFEKIMWDRNIEDSEKILQSLKNFYPAFFEIINSNKETIEEAIEKLIWFYKRGKEQENHKETKSNNNEKRPVYSYDADSEYIFSAFWHDYKVDLTKDKIHWWKFKAFELGLNDTNTYEKIKSYRSYEGKDKDMKELKKYWQLPLPKDITDEADEIAKKLMQKG